MGQTKGLSSRVLTDCGIVVALSVVLVLISFYIPVLGTLATMIWAVPVMALVLRRGIFPAILSVLVSAVVSILFAGVVGGILSAAWIGFFGLIYGVCFRKKISPLSTLAAGTIAAGIIMVITLAIGAILGVFSFDGLTATLRESVQQTLSMYESAGILDQLLPQGMTAAEYGDKILSIMMTLLPAVFILYGMASAALNYLFAALILKRLNFDITPLPPFREWHFPWWIMWAVVVALVAYLMGTQWDGGYYHQIALNIIYLYLPIFLVSGVSMVAWTLYTCRAKTATKVMVWLAVILLMRFSLPLLLILGALDPLLDYRKIWNRNPNKKS